MKCPIDNETLLMADRNGVEIDYCPKCRGVWLDRGELDKIIEQPLPASSVSRGHDTSSLRQDTSGRYRKKKKDSYLSELFDF